MGFHVVKLPYCVYSEITSHFVPRNRDLFRNEAFKFTLVAFNSCQLVFTLEILPVIDDFHEILA
jgi:hypothetical protein